MLLCLVWVEVPRYKLLLVLGQTLNLLFYDVIYYLSLEARVDLTRLGGWLELME